LHELKLTKYKTWTSVQFDKEKKSSVNNLKVIQITKENGLIN
jgi:hypothetical protein